MKSNSPWRRKGSKTISFDQARNAIRSYIELHEGKDFYLISSPFHILKNINMSIDGCTDGQAKLLYSDFYRLLDIKGIRKR